MSTSDDCLIVSDKHELLALHRALLEAKFLIAPSDSAIAGSPYLASIANRVVDLLSKSDAAWTDWRKIENHPERIDFLHSKIRISRLWSSMPDPERREYVMNLASPFVMSEGLLSELVMQS